MRALPLQTSLLTHSGTLHKQETCPFSVPPTKHLQVTVLWYFSYNFISWKIFAKLDWKKVDKRRQIIYWKKVDKFRHFKNNTIPADVIPNDSEDLFILSNSNWSWALGPWGTGDKISQKKSSSLFWNIYTASASSRIQISRQKCKIFQPLKFHFIYYLVTMLVSV